MNINKINNTYKNCSPKTFRLLALMLITVMVMFMTGCTNSEEPEVEPVEDTTYEIAMICGQGDINQSLNSAAWRGISEYAEANGKRANYYMPVSMTNSNWLKAIEEAVDKGASVVIAPGMCLSEAVYSAQDLYPEVSFVLIDGEPRNETKTDYKTGSNTVCMIYSEQQVGYLAGFSAVSDGFTELGFIGGNETPQITRYGYGFLKGADDAAVEMGTFLNVKYCYAGTYNACEEVKARASSWYSAGTELIFSCGGQTLASVIEAAKEDLALGTIKENGDLKRSSVINVDTTTDDISDMVVLTTAMKGVSESVDYVLESYYSNEFKGGATRVITAADNGVGLPFDESDFRTFTKERYNDIFGRLQTGKIDIPVDTTVESADQLVLSNTTVTIEGHVV